tara:strand:+ start:977 stop:1150 length:174 start_codon:yes stop_codon:yes gene_type:complete
LSRGFFLFLFLPGLAGSSSSKIYLFPPGGRPRQPGNKNQEGTRKEQERNKEGTRGLC